MVVLGQIVSAAAAAVPPTEGAVTVTVETVLAIEPHAPEATT